MAKRVRLYSEVVSGSSGDETDLIISPAASPKHSFVNWLKDYQEEEEHMALEKAMNLSKVCQVNQSNFTAENTII